MKCSVYLPVGLDSNFVATLKEQGPEIIEEGVNYAAALKNAQEAVRKDERKLVSFMKPSLPMTAKVLLTRIVSKCLLMVKCYHHCPIVYY